MDQFTPSFTARQSRYVADQASMLADALTRLEMLQQAHNELQEQYRALLVEKSDGSEQEES